MLDMVSRGLFRDGENLLIVYSSNSRKLTVSLCSESPVFQLLVAVHNTIQRVQCFQCPPPALCTDARDLVQEVPTSLVTRA